MLEGIRQALAQASGQRRFRAIRLRFYQDYLDSRLMFREFVQERTGQLYRRGHPAFPILHGIGARLQAGVSVAAALRPVAPAVDIALISAYELDNRLNAGIAQIIRVVQEQEKLAREVRATLVKPVAYLAAGFAMLAGGVPLMVETLGPLLDPATLTLDQRLLIALGAWLQRQALPIVAGVTGASLALVVTLPVWTGRVRRFLDRHSPVHRMYRAYQGASFLQILAVQLTVSPQLERALGAIARNATPWLGSYILDILARLPHCRTRPMQAIDVGLLDVEVIDSLALVALRGTTESAIALRAEQSNDNALRSIRRSATVMQQLGILLAGGLLVWMATSLVLTMIRTNIDRMQRVQVVQPR